MRRGFGTQVYNSLTLTIGESIMTYTSSPMNITSCVMLKSGVSIVRPSISTVGGPCLLIVTLKCALSGVFQTPVALSAKTVFTPSTSPRSRMNSLSTRPECTPWTAAVAASNTSQPGKRINSNGGTPSGKGVGVAVVVGGAGVGVRAVAVALASTSS